MAGTGRGIFGMMVLRRVLVSILLLTQCLTVGMVLAPGSALAAEGAYCKGEYGGFFGFPTWYKYLHPHFSDTSQSCDIQFNPREPKDYVGIGLVTFDILTHIAGYAALAFVMYGAFQFLTSQGEPDKLAAARTTLTNAMIGLIIALFAVVIVNLVGGTI